MDENKSNLMTTFLNLGGWGWIIFGMVLVVIEIFAPSTIFLWFGVGALITGLISLVFTDIGWQYELLIFALLSITLLLTARRYLLNKTGETDEPSLNQRGVNLIGRRAVVAESILNGEGKVKVGDSYWLAQSDEAINEDAIVEIIGVEGTALKVKSAQDIR